MSDALDAPAMAAEFDTIPAWTERVVGELGPEYAIPAACRGTGSPYVLQWLCAALELGPSVRLVDAGAGVGGPAAFAAREYGAVPFLVEPMPAACHAAHQLFGLPAVAATVQQMPFADGTFEAAWSLGVLCTTQDKAGALRELRRVLVPQGRLALLVFVQIAEKLPCRPEGNQFPTEASLARLIDQAGLTVPDRASLIQFAPAPDEWKRRADVVDATIAARYGHDPRWITADEQSRCMGQLLGGGHVVGQLLSLRVA